MEKAELSNKVIPKKSISCNVRDAITYLDLDTYSCMFFKSEAVGFPFQKWFEYKCLYYY